MSEKNQPHVVLNQKSQEIRIVSLPVFGAGAPLRKNNFN
jgi:hypothetical protein